MSRLFKKIILLTATIALVSCNNELQKNESVIVATTISPYSYLISKIGGNKVKTITAIPPKSTPHHYEPSVREIQKLSEAEYYFRVGDYMPFEEVWIDKLSGINEMAKIFDLSKGVAYIDKDPHIWLSVSNLKIISNNIFNNLKKIIPEEEKFLEDRYKNFLDSLNRVDNEIYTALDAIELKKLLVFHGSWTYFSHDYNWQQIVIEHGNREPSPQELSSILSYTRENNIPVVFTDPQHGVSSAKIIASELNIPVDIIDPLQKNILTNLIDVKTKIEKHYK